MGSSFSNVVIIYNPNSTGDGPADARALKKQIEQRIKDMGVTLKETEYAGHAKEIAAEYARVNRPVLLVSASGDGGYNELINGVLEHATKNVVVAVLPSGNANDHDTAIAERPLIDRIIDRKTRMIDVISINAAKDGKDWRRYAHSYVGLGITAYVGEKLTKADLNYVKEKWLTFKYLIRFNHVTAKVENQKRFHRYSSIIVGNIDRMSKVVKLNQATEIDDGVIDLYVTRTHTTLGLIFELLRAGLLSAPKLKSARSFKVQTKRTSKIQLDGEVETIDACTIVFNARKQVLRTLR